MKILIAVSILLLVCIASAEEIPLTIFEQKDFGPGYEEDFDDIEVTMECDREVIYIHIDDEDQPVTGAIVRIIYVDYSTPLLASGPTNVEGEFDYTLVGEKNYMRGLFLVVVEKEGYKQKEAHFDISRCIAPAEESDAPLVYDSTPPIIPETVPETPESEITPEPEIVPEVVPEPKPEPEPQTEENLSKIPEFNTTGNETGEPESAEPQYLCASSFILLLAAILLVFYH